MPVRDGAVAPLAGVRVLEVSRLVPGALVGWWLAALGAEVVKLEPPGKGDYLRAIPPYLGSGALMHRVMDQGKKSMVLDLRDRDRHGVFRELCGRADIVIDGNRPGSMTDHGIEYEQVRGEFPQLIVCSVTGFGQRGPLADLPSHGFTIDTLAGVSPIIENADGTLTLGWELSSTIGIETGALSAVVAVMGSLLQVRAGGVGSWIDVSLWDAAVHANRFAMSWALSGGESPLRMHDQGPLYGAYRCLDGHAIWFAALEERFWRRFCDVVDRPDLVDRWSGHGNEVGFGTGDLRAELQMLFAGRNADEWAELFWREDIPGNRILSADEVAQHPHFKARGLEDPVRRDDGCAVVGAAPLWIEQGHRLGHGLNQAPELGADTAAVLQQWIGVTDG